LMKNCKMIAFVMVLLMVATISVFAEDGVFGLDVSAQMDYTYADGDDMGSFGLGDSEATFSYEEDKFYAELNVQFESAFDYVTSSTSTTTWEEPATDVNTTIDEDADFTTSTTGSVTIDYSDIIDDMYFSYDFTDALGLKGGFFSTAFADDWWYGSTMWGVELYGSVSVISYQFDVVNGTDNKFVLQPVVAVSPVEMLTLSFDGYVDLGESENNKVAASAELSTGPIWAYADFVYLLDSGEYYSACEFDYSLNDDMAVYTWLDIYSDDDYDADVTVAFDYTALPVNFMPYFTYYIGEENTWEFVLNFEYDFSL
ncbi:MAG: hypothetical protein PQJ60_14270, partial [Spirochaetales bacterium]|nr:hypothetical protein [Spirochaetales bacterium]